MSKEQLRYPIGRFVKPEVFSREAREFWIGEIESLVPKLRRETEHLSNEQIDARYRPGGWTIRQVVSHLGDSHMNALVRLKLALTESVPEVKPYYENRWAELADSISMPMEPALNMLDGIHARWVVVLKSLSEDQFRQSFYHPEHKYEVRIEENLALYAWHSQHHLAHVVNAKQLNYRE